VGGEEMLAIKSVVLENVFSYARASVEFSEGLTAFAGHNGSGKTSLLESILIALTLKTDGVRREIVRRASGSAAGHGRIILTLEGVTGKRYQISLVVSSRRDGRGQGRDNRDKIVQAELVEEVNGSRKHRASGVKAVRGELARLLGFQGLPDYSSFLRHSVIAQQGSLRVIAEKLGVEREFRELIEDALGLKNVQTAIEKLSNVALHSDHAVAAPVTLGQAKTLKSSRIYGDIVRRIELARRRLAEARSRAEAARRRRERLQAEREEVVARLREAERASGALEKVKSDMVRVESELREVRQRLAQLERERRRLEQGLAAAEARRRELERLASLADAVDLIVEYKEVLAEVAQLEGRESELRMKAAAARDLAKYRGEAERYSEVEKRLRSLEEKLRELEKQRDSLENVVSQATILTGRLARIAAKLGIPWREDAPRMIVDVLEDAIERLRRELEELESERKTLLQKRSEAAARLEEARKALEALRSATKPSCPVCGRPLDESQRLALARKLAGEAARLEDELESLDERLGEVERELEEARRSLEALERMLSEAASTVSALESMLASRGFKSLAEVKAELERIAGEIARVSSEKARLERERRRLEPAYRYYLAALQNAERLGVSVEDLEELEREYREVYARLSEARKRLKRLEQEILSLTGAKSVREAEEIVRRAAKAREELASLEREASTLRSKLDAVKEAEEEARRRAEELRERLESLKEEASKLGGLASKLAELRARLEEVERGIREAHSEERSSVEAAEQAEKEIKAYEDIRRKFLVGMAAKVILARVQEAAYEAALARLIDEMNAFLTEFGLNIWRVERADSKSFRLVVYREGNVRTEISSLSGGEKAVLALAFLMAFNRVVGGRLSFLILDEPTAELDEERRRVLMDLLRRMTSEGAVRQVIVVAHHDDVLDLADRGCRVRYESGRGSVVEC